MTKKISLGKSTKNHKVELSKSRYMFCFRRIFKVVDEKQIVQVLREEIVKRYIDSEKLKNQ